jgi:hypothetical protein
MHFAPDRDISRRTLLLGAAGLMALPAVAAQQGLPIPAVPRA